MRYNKIYIVFVFIMLYFICTVHSAYKPNWVNDYSIYFLGQQMAETFMCAAMLVALWDTILRVLCADFLILAISEMIDELNDANTDFMYNDYLFLTVNLLTTIHYTIKFKKWIEHGQKS